LNLFLAHLGKGNVSFCHHLASILCRPLTFHILIFSSETTQPNEAFDRKYQKGKKRNSVVIIFLLDLKYKNIKKTVCRSMRFFCQINTKCGRIMIGL
jgi:hypothetical protein